LYKWVAGEIGKMGVSQENSPVELKIELEEIV
jgi:hypothetical protein